MTARNTLLPCVAAVHVCGQSQMARCEQQDRAADSIIRMLLRIAVVGVRLCVRSQRAANSATRKLNIKFI